jgi:hypothetical protein
MNTIKYLQLFSISILILIISISFLDLSYIRRQCQHEGFDECESVDKGSGLPLSVLNTITFRNNTSYSEIGEEEIRRLTSSVVDIVFWGTIKEPVDKLSINDNNVLKQVSEQLLSKLNEQLDASENPFTVINQSITSKHNTSSQEYIISSKHLIYREGKMYGFLLNVQSIWTNPKLDLKGFVEVTPTGIVMEDNILMVRNDNKTNNYRSYGDSVSFIQSEAIIKDKEYEDNVTQKQMYGLLQDRGISAKSFANN